MHWSKRKPRGNILDGVAKVEIVLRTLDNVTLREQTV